MNARHLKLKALLAPVWALCISVHGMTLDFDINFVVLTKNRQAQEKATLEALKQEVDILNEFFVTERREKIVNFRFKSAFSYDDIANSTCSFTRLGDSQEKHDSKRVRQEYFSCKDERIRDPHAINFYVVDSYSEKFGYDNYTTSRGAFNNGSQPFLLFDWARLGHQKLSPEEHEMGHSFGLPHVCYPEATKSTPTNIMASQTNCKGSAGLRNIGFNEEQTKVITRNARIIYQNFHLNEYFPPPKKSPDPFQDSVGKYIKHGGSHFKAIEADNYQHLHQFDRFRIFYSLEGKNAIKLTADLNENDIPDSIESLMYQFVLAKQIFDYSFLLRDPLAYDNSHFVLKGARYFDIKIRSISSKAYSSNKDIQSKFLITEKHHLHQGSVVSIVIDSDFENNNLIPFHELLHAYQNARTMLRNDWFSEGTSRWLEKHLLYERPAPESLPGDVSELHVLLGKGYNAAGFWNSLSSRCNSASSFSELLIHEQPGRESIIAIPAIRTEFGAANFLRTLLDELEIQSIRATVERGLPNYMDWPINEQKSRSNDSHILRALQNTILQECDTDDAELNHFIGILEDYLRENWKAMHKERHLK